MCSKTNKTEAKNVCFWLIKNQFQSEQIFFLEIAFFHLDIVTWSTILFKNVLS
jgi:hypothetical protein